MCVCVCVHRDKGFDIKWVDDTHAIGVFSSAVAGKLSPVLLADKQYVDGNKIVASLLPGYMLPRYRQHVAGNEQYVALV